MQLVLLHCQINAKYMETGKQSKKAIVLALPLPPTVHLVTKVTECIITFTEMTVIDYNKTIFISTGTRIWHSYLFGMLSHHVNHVDVDASF